MNIVVKIVSAVVPIALLAGGGAAYLARSTPAAAALSATPASAGQLASPSAAPIKPVTSAQPVTSAKPAAATASDKFNTWINGIGATLLENDLGVLSQTKADAAAQNVAALQADASALITAGNASLADPPPSHAAHWNAAFAAMVQAGQDIAAGNLAGAVAESSSVESNIYAFNSETS